MDGWMDGWMTRWETGKEGEKRIRNDYSAYVLENEALAPLEAAEAVGSCKIRLMEEACRSGCNVSLPMSIPVRALRHGCCRRGLLQRAGLDWIILVQAVYPYASTRITVRTSA